MFNANNLQNIIKSINEAQNDDEFGNAINKLKTYLKDIGIDTQYIFELEQQAFYMKNDYSDKDNADKRNGAKKKVFSYIEKIMSNGANYVNLANILENYYFFIEALLEREPDKRGGIKKEKLNGIKIENEYDVQFLLYAYLKPIYPMARAEVNDDTGYSTVRADIELDSNNVIEVKCTRDNMQRKKLVEEIEADMIHYNYANIYFFIYDKSKIIDNPSNFKSTYERKVNDKNIHIIIHQPKIL